MPSSSSSFQGNARNVSRFGHGMCQNWATTRLGIIPLEHSRQKGQMIVLDEDERRASRSPLREWLRRRFRSPPVVALPVLLTEARPVESCVAKRPKPFIGEPVIVFILDSLWQPNAAERCTTGRLVEPHTIARIHRLPVGIPAPVRHPYAARSPHYADRSRPSSRLPALCNVTVRLLRCEYKAPDWKPR